MPKNSITYITPGLYPLIKGGAEKQSSIIVKGLLEKGFKVEVLTLHSRIAEKKKNHVKFLGFGNRKTLLISAIIHFMLLKKQRTLVFSQLNLFTFCCIALSINKKILLRLSNSGNQFDIDRLFNRRLSLLKKLVLSKVANFISINAQISEQLKSWGFKNTIRINNTIEQFEYNIQGIPSLIMISRFKKHKNFSFLPVLSEKLNHRYPIHIFGNHTEEYDEIVHELKNSKSIIIEESYEEIRIPFENKLPILIHPSFEEGTSNSILEALSFGIPVIANDIDANKIFGMNGENGVFLYSTSEPTQWANSILKLFSNNKFYSEIADNAKSYIEGNHKMDQIINQWVKVISK